MSKRKTRTAFFIVLIVIMFIPPMVIAKINGMGTSDYTNGPTQNRNCTNCHGGTANTGSGQFQLSGLPATYTPNSTYPLTLRITQTGQTRWGFQLKALTSTGPAGTLVVTDATHTSLTYGSTTGFLNQNSSGTYTGATIGQWSFNWTAPSTATNTVRFYASGLAANNDGSEGAGDYTYTLASTVNPPSPTSVDSYLWKADVDEKRNR